MRSFWIGAYGVPTRYREVVLTLSKSGIKVQRTKYKQQITKNKDQTVQTFKTVRVTRVNSRDPQGEFI